MSGDNENIWNSLAKVKLNIFIMIIQYLIQTRTNDKRTLEPKINRWTELRFAICHSTAQQLLKVIKKPAEKKLIKHSYMYLCRVCVCICFVIARLTTYVIVMIKYIQKKNEEEKRIISRNLFFSSSFTLMLTEMIFTFGGKYLVNILLRSCEYSTTF